MKASLTLLVSILIFSCGPNKPKDYLLSLQPEAGKNYRYSVEDKFQIMAAFPDGDREIYTKLLYDYTVKYDRKDSVLNGLVTFNNFRIEFEDGHGVQVFDTKFDKADWKNTELWFYYSMLNKNIPIRFASNSHVQEIKAVEQLKKSMIDAYSKNGIGTPELSAMLRKFVDNFVVNRMAYENYAFYTGKPLQKDSSFKISFTSLMPLHHSIQYNYNLRAETDSTLTLAAKGTVALKDSLKQQVPFVWLKNKRLVSEGFDEILLQKGTNVVKYRKSYFNLSDSLVLDQKSIPARIIIEKETKLKKPE